MKIIQSLFIFLLSIEISYSQTDSSKCGKVYFDAYSNCKQITYRTLPKNIKELMKNNKCDVNSSSSYDYGFQINLNDDDELEYIFCCEESTHGPCYAKIYSKINNKWTIIYETAGYINDCEKILIVLESKNDGFHNLCIDEKIVRFFNGKYH